MDSTGDSSQGVGMPFCSFILISHTSSILSCLLVPSALICVDHGLQSLRGGTCSSMVYSWLRSFEGLTSSGTKHFYSGFVIYWLKYIFKEMLQDLLMGSVVVGPLQSQLWPTRYPMTSHQSHVPSSPPLSSVYHLQQLQSENKQTNKPPMN